MLQHLASIATGIFPTIMDLPKRRRELKDNALRAISHALNETYLYYRDFRNGAARDLDREAELSRYWSRAAIPIRHIDKELASICEAKSDYWVNPEYWDNERIEEAGIELDNVRRQYRDMLT
jgi:hypothetical protein